METDDKLNRMKLALAKSALSAALAPRYDSDWVELHAEKLSGTIAVDDDGRIDDEDLKLAVIKATSTPTAAKFVRATREDVQRLRDRYRKPPEPAGEVLKPYIEQNHRPRRDND